MPWFCCCCHSGGFSDALVTTCIDCYHTKCTYCNIESYSLSMDSKVVYIPAPSAYPPPSRCTTPSQVSNLGVRLEALPPDLSSIVTVASYPIGLSRPSPLAVANPTAFDTTHILNGYGFEVGFGYPVDGQVVTVWYCCACSHGPHNYYLDTGCVSCHRHNRCDGCRVETISSK
ncbi:hypothetical protein CC80DRAFT_267209 [Byssothecium circinans]|uniref:Uncharacterized protein n=1 Tax=Byssothecium circinans TaxID=147558 RepID=A0A6A5UAD6_9PLEO|nr:hypothetical protein CC80DRAFT_267209 [Byssothecium circinans]